MSTLTVTAKTNSIGNPITLGESFKINLSALPSDAKTKSLFVKEGMLAQRNLNGSWDGNLAYIDRDADLVVSQNLYNRLFVFASKYNTVI